MTAGATTDDLRFSVVVPTYQRREAAVACVRSLEAQDFPRAFEVIVVVDGSTDGTREALEAIAAAIPLTVLTQPNQGAAAARNRGARAATGELLLFLDDDMEADPRLLAEHDRLHRGDADVVLGHMPLHPGSPSGPLSRGVAAWADERLARLSKPGARLTLYDLLTGQISLRRATFLSAGGFDGATFTREGSWGNEDIDFVLRLLNDGLRVVFTPRAVSHQRYMVRPGDYLRQWRQAGRADVALARKHPERAAELNALTGARSAGARWLWRPLLATPVLGSAVLAALRVGAPRLIRRSEGRVASKVLFAARRLEHLEGQREAGGLPPPGHVVALAYHAIADLGHSRLAPWAVPPRLLDRHLAELGRLGYELIDVDRLLAGLAGAGPWPARGALLTFDDATVDLHSAARPVLAAHRAPAVAFAVSGLLGGVNAWDAHLGTELGLLDPAGLADMVRAGVEVGAHSRTHRSLPSLSSADLHAEVCGSVAELAAVLPRPRVFAYPYGEHDERVVAAVARCGLAAAFTVDAGVIRPGADPLRLPRIEIGRRDTVARMRLKVVLAARAPESLRAMSRWGERASAVRRLVR